MQSDFFPWLEHDDTYDTNILGSSNAPVRLNFFNLQSAPKSALAQVEHCGQFQAFSGHFLRMLTSTTVVSWLLFVTHAYETWHLVDLSQVICPKPSSSMTDAPEFPEYNLGINYTNELQVDAPHIVGFIRASQQAVSITFKIEDFYGEQVHIYTSRSITVAC